MLTLLHTLSGSRLYGTHQSDSDFDYTMVNLPDGRDILLKRDGASHHPNSPDGDVQRYPIAKFIAMLQNGEGPALDALFAPPSMHKTPEHPSFRVLREKAGELIGSSIPGMLSFCVSQLRRSMDGGERLNAINEILSLIQEASLIGDILDGFQTSSNRYPKILSIEEKPKNGGGNLVHLVVCGRAFAVTMPIKDFVHALESMKRKYGPRTIDAAETGVDRKALMHAVRIGQQGLEYLTTGHITFPRPNAGYLQQIRTGMIPLDETMQEVEHLVEKVRTLSHPKNHHDIAESLIEHYHLQSIKQTYNF